MLRLARILLREVRLPLKEPFRISSGVTQERRILLLELTDREGRTAWSECVAGEAPNYSPETIDTAWLMITGHLGPRVLDRTFSGADQVYRVLEEDIRGHRMAKAALEMGCWDLEARVRGVPLARLIGAERERVEVGISLGIQLDPQTLADRVREALEAGYRKVKVKIRPGQDLAFVRAAREAAGPGGPLMVDANNAYTLQDAGLFEAMDDLDLLMIEQPLAWDDLVQHAHLQSRLRTPICLDESITGEDRVRDMLELGSGRVVNIKPGRVGGLASSIAIHDLCRAEGIPVWCGGMLESGVGRAFNIALASLPGFTLPGDISPSSRYWERDVVVPEFEMDARGTIPVPDSAAGIGVEVDMGRVDDLTVRQAALSGD